MTDPWHARTPMASPATVGILCGAGAALFWAAGFAAARHGTAIGYSPADLALHRFAWAGFFLLPVLWRDGGRDLGGAGWAGGMPLTLFRGAPLPVIRFSGLP